MFSEEFLFFRSNFKIEKHKEVFSKDFTSKHFSGLVDWCFRNALQKFHKQSKSFRSQSEKKTIQLFINKTKENLWNCSFGHARFRFRFRQHCRNNFCSYNPTVFCSSTFKKIQNFWLSSKKLFLRSSRLNKEKGVPPTVLRNFCLRKLLPKIRFFVQLPERITNLTFIQFLFKENSYGHVDCIFRNPVDKFCQKTEFSKLQVQNKMNSSFKQNSFTSKCISGNVKSGLI